MVSGFLEWKEAGLEEGKELKQLCTHHHVFDQSGNPPPLNIKVVVELKLRIHATPLYSENKKDVEVFSTHLREARLPVFMKERIQLGL